MRHRSELIRRTARDLGFHQRYVSLVVREFITQMSRLLAEAGAVVLDDFGTFTVVVSRLPNPVTREVEDTLVLRVHFSKSRALKELLDEKRESIMDKLGVDTSTGKDDERLEKMASEGCPECGSELTKHGSVIVCPKCGSAPFEQKSER